MVKFTHYLVTRFNVRIDGNGPEYIRPDARNTNWEEERMPLFAHYCVASLAGQSNKGFIWLIYTDVNTPETILQRIKNVIADAVPYIIVPVENFAGLLTDLRTRCAEASTPYVITTRLDNDDGVSKDYIQTVQSNFEPIDRLVINLLGGVNYNLKENILTYHRHSLRNSFCSIVEKRKDSEMITIMGFNHLHPPPDSKTKNIPLPFAFWMNLHHQNAAIRNNRGIPMVNKNFMKHYNIEPQLLQISIPHTIAYTVRWFPNALKRKIAFKVRTFLGKWTSAGIAKSTTH